MSTNSSATPGSRRTNGPRLSARGWLGTVADVISVITAVVAVRALITDAPVPQVILAIALGLLALTFMALSFHLQRQHYLEAERERRRSRHAESLGYLGEAVGALRTGAAKLAQGAEPSSFTQPATLAVCKLAEAMTSATGVKCRAVVKTVYAPPGDRQDVAVHTFATSDLAETRPGQGVDWVKENTDFDEILYGDREYFLSNDLSADMQLGYRNSHFTPQSVKAGLPYNSTIVWPIQGAEGDLWDIKGFLCVDTKEAGSFNDLDILVGKVLSPVWYLALDRFDEATFVAEQAQKRRTAMSSGAAARPAAQRGHAPTGRAEPGP